MKNRKTLFRIAALALSAVMLAGCGKSEFGVIDNTPKKMVISAENADKDDMIMTGGLEVGEGETVTVTSELTKGEVCVELFIQPEEQSIEEVPELEGDPILMANLKPGESAFAEMQAGDYIVRATCLEKASGTVQIEVKPGS
ncbi:MAG: hypothetical protein J5941_03260 [Solobacterium sp.]|nr:hypothetical protein [Solobacterium sp.]